MSELTPEEKKLVRKLTHAIMYPQYVLFAILVIIAIAVDVYVFIIR